MFGRLANQRISVFLEIPDTHLQFPQSRQVQAALGMAPSMYATVAGVGGAGNTAAYGRLPQRAAPLHKVHIANAGSIHGASSGRCERLRVKRPASGALPQKRHGSGEESAIH